MLKEQRASLPELLSMGFFLSIDRFRMSLAHAFFFTLFLEHWLPQSLDEAFAAEQLVCRVCHVEASGQKSYFDHISSQQHAKRLRRILCQCLTCGLQFESALLVPPFRFVSL